MMMAKQATEASEARAREQEEEEKERRRLDTLRFENERGARHAAGGGAAAGVVNAFGDDSSDEDEDREVDKSGWTTEVIERTVAHVFAAKDWKRRLEKVEKAARKDGRVGFVLDRGGKEGREFWDRVGREEARRVTEDGEGGRGKGRDRSRSRDRNRSRSRSRSRSRDRDKDRGRDREGKLSRWGEKKKKSRWGR
jgi:hypothetical protein